MATKEGASREPVCDTILMTRTVPGVQGITHGLSPHEKLTKKYESRVNFMKTCISCGMPMTKPSDFPLEDVSKDYCKYCAKPDGSMQSYPEKLKGTIEFLIRTQGLDKEAARQLAVRTLAKMPAWNGVEVDL